MKKHPNIDGVLKELDERITEQDKRKILAMSKTEFTIGQHFGMGLWIRNRYSGNEQLLKEIAAAQDTDCRLIHRDDVSGFILEKYYDHLKRIRKKEA